MTPWRARTLWLFLVGGLLVLGCQQRGGAGKDSQAVKMNPAQVERQALCDEYLAVRLAAGAEPRNTFMNNCMTAPTDLVRCLLQRHYDYHRAECDAVIKANPGLPDEIR